MPDTGTLMAMICGFHLGWDFATGFRELGLGCRVV